MQSDPSADCISPHSFCSICDGSPHCSPLIHSPYRIHPGEPIPSINNWTFMVTAPTTKCTIELVHVLHDDDASRYCATSAHGAVHSGCSNVVAMMPLQTVLSQHSHLLNEWFEKNQCWIFHNQPRITGSSLPSIQSLYRDRALKRTDKILMDPSHPAGNYFQYLPSGVRFQNFRGSKRLTDSFYPSAIKMYNACHGR